MAEELVNKLMRLTFWIAWMEDKITLSGSSMLKVVSSKRGPGGHR